VQHSGSLALRIHLSGILLSNIWT